MTNIEVSFKMGIHDNPKNPLLIPRIYFKKIQVKIKVKLWFLVIFNIIHFSRKFYWNSSSFSEDMNFYFFNFNYFCRFFGRQHLYHDIRSFLTWNYFKWVA